MTEQYYYMGLYILRQLGQMIATIWWRYVDIVHTYPVTAITILLSSILVLIIMSIARKGRVTVIEGNAIHELIRAMRGDKPNTSQSK